MQFPTEVLRESVATRGDDTEHGLRFVEASEWQAEDKYQYCDIVFEHDGKFYELNLYRSGSPFSDYYWCWEDWGDKVECHEVVRQEIVVTKWVRATQKG